MQSFKELNLPPALMANLEKMNYATPTPIQALGIPLGLAGRDILGSAATGTGKTAAFGIPLVAKLMSAPRGTALILTPTRELAVQVLDVLSQLIGKGSPIRSTLVIGGDSMPMQINQLRQRPRLIVGTPGRINDHLERGTIMLADVNFLVLDETDRMLDMGFAVQLERIFKFLPPTRQTLMFSATLPDSIVKISSKYLKSPERISAGEHSKPAVKIQQDVKHIPTAEKYNQLVSELQVREGSVIIFVRTKRGADRLAERLRRQNMSADAIHGDLQQRKRERVIQAFRDKKHRIMVATDIAARGLDIPHIEHVINFDLPQCPEDYIHRIGRTARAGAEGASLCLVSPDDQEKWDAIQKMLNPAHKPERRSNGGGTRPQRGGGGHRGYNGGGKRSSEHRGGEQGGGERSGKARPRRHKRRPAAAKVA